MDDYVYGTAAALEPMDFNRHKGPSVGKWADSESKKPHKELSMSPTHTSHKSFASYPAYKSDPKEAGSQKICQVFFSGSTMNVPTHAIDCFAGKSVWIGIAKATVKITLPDKAGYTNADLSSFRVQPSTFQNIPVKSMSVGGVEPGLQVLLSRGGNQVSAGKVYKTKDLVAYTGPGESGAYLSRSGDCGAIVSSGEYAIGFHVSTIPGESNNFQMFTDQDLLFFRGERGVPAVSTTSL